MDVIGVLRGKYWAPAFALKIGETAIRNCLRDQLKFLREESLKYMGNHPVLFTEIGIPYDMDNKNAYKTGDYSSQTSAMDANHYALEGSTANGFTLWLYETEVRGRPSTDMYRSDTFKNNHEWGDLWNGEDLSIWSRDDLELPSGGDIRSLDPTSPAYSESHSNGDQPGVEPRNLKRALTSPSISSNYSQTTKGYRAAEAYLRPSPIYVSGRLDNHVFDLVNCTFIMSLTARAATSSEAPTEIYLPEFHFPEDHTVIVVSGGKWEIETEASTNIQRLLWWHAEGEQDIKVEGVKRKVGEYSNSAEDVSYLEQCQRGQCVMM